MKFILRHPIACLLSVVLILGALKKSTPRAVYFVDDDGKKTRIGEVSGYFGDTTFYGPNRKITGSAEDVEKFGGGLGAVVNHTCWICREGMLVSTDGDVWYSYPRAKSR